MKIPIDQIVSEIKKEHNPRLAYSNILRFGRQALDSDIWDFFEKVNINRDITRAQEWLQNELQQHPMTKGIYLGLDTLNMDEGEGSNVAIGFSSKGDPQEMDMDWIFRCDVFGESHLIYGLYEVSDAFVDDEKWTYEERNCAEYVVFLGYSGIVLREALLDITHSQDFLSVWGFHDGDMFYLVQSIGKEMRVLSDFPV